MTLTRTDILAALKAKEIANLRKLAEEALACAETLERSNSESLNDMRRLSVYTAGIALVDDGDFHAARQVLCEENGWDEEGYPVDSYGTRLGESSARVMLTDGSWEGRAVA